MCGIFGYTGSKRAATVILEGLRRLEYRGYDSWGIAVVNQDGGKIDVVKKTGSIGVSKDIETLGDSTIGVGHTRWATHGGVTFGNAHPHYSSDNSFVVAQNGIVENFQELKRMLMEKGYVFESETDTEVIVRLIEEKLKSSDTLKDAVREAFLELDGRNTIIVLGLVGEEIIAVRNGSPLVLGVSESLDEVYFASDTLSFADHTNKVVFLNDLDMAHYVNGELLLSRVENESTIEIDVVELDQAEVEVNKEGFDHYMIKEIIEQQHTIREAAQYSLEELTPLLDAIRQSKRVYTIGAGTAGYAAGQIAYFLRTYAKIDAQELKPYEVDSYVGLGLDGDLVLAVSQSGETADTLEALEKLKGAGARIASVVNMQGSTMTRMSEFQYLSRSGPEICVASTKAFTAQVSFGFLIAMSLIDQYDKAKEVTQKLSTVLKDYFSTETFTNIGSIAQELSRNNHFFVLGKGENFYVALEGSLKVKEITYKHFEGFSSGELKHGVIALVEEGTPVFAIMSDDEYKTDIMNAVAEVKARGARVVGIGPENNDLFDFHIPTSNSEYLSSLLNVVPFQIFAYQLSVTLGLDPDKPRNLAKSVTVK